MLLFPYKPFSRYVRRQLTGSIPVRENGLPVIFNILTAKGLGLRLEAKWRSPAFGIVVL